MSTSTTVGIRLQLEGAGAVERGLAGVQSRVGDAAKALGALAAGTLSAAAFTSWIKGAIDAADQTSKLAQSTGLLTEEVAGLKLAFEQSGVGEKFGEIMAKLSSEAAKGNKAFAAMGVSVTDASGKLKGTRDLLADVADKFASYADGSSKTALAVALLGESGAKAIPLLNGGAAALADFDDKAKALGLTIDTKTAKAAERFNDNLDLIKKNATGAGIAIANNILPTLVDLTDAFSLAALRGDGLLDKLRLFGSTTYTTKGFNLGKDIKDVKETIDELNEARERYLRANSDTSGIDQALESASKKLEYFRELQRMTTTYSGDDQSSAEARRLGIETLKVSAPVLEKNTNLTNRNSDAKKALAAAEREAAQAAAELAKTRERAVGIAEKEAQEVIRRVSGLAEGNEALREEIAMIGVGAQKRAELVALKERESIAQAELNLVVAQSAGASADVIAMLQQEISLRSQRVALLEQKSAAELAQTTQENQQKAAADAAKAAAGEWQKTSDRIEGALTDALMRGFESGKGFGENLGDSVANYFKTSVANAIASAITNAIMSAITSTQWGRALSSSLGGGGGSGFSWVDIAQQAYGYYSSGSATSAGIAAGAGTVNTTTLSGVSAASAGSTGVAGGTATAGASAGASSSTLASGGFTGYGYLGYAALIAAAVIVAEGLYDKGFNRGALGLGNGETNRVGYTDYTSSAGMGNSAIYRGSVENANRQLGDAIGLSEKWTDILSGTVRMATLFGRRLKGYGLQADISGEDVNVSGYQYYKGGLFRSNKTVKQDVDSRDAEAFKAEIENIREGSRNMARALGYSTEAIDSYTGSLKVNFKGAKTAEEQGKRMAEAMDDLQMSLLKAASGGKIAGKEFEQMMEGVRQSIQNAGISTEALADILLQGMTGRLSAADVGAQLSEVIVGGIYNSIASNYAGVIAQAFTSQIITPIFTALAAGVPISQAISKTAISNIVATAQTAAQALNEIFNNAEFQAAISDIESAISGVSGAVGSVRAPSFRVPTVRAVDTSAQDTAREREQLTREILRLEGKTTELRRRELQDIKPGNRALQERVWALEDEAAALEKVKDLQNAWTGLTDSIEEEIKRLRGEVLGDSSHGLAYLQAQFATTTAQARAMDQEAAGRLPELSGRLADIYLETAASQSEYQARVNSLAASLEETNRITRSTAGIDADSTQKVKDEETAQQIKLLQKSIDVLTETLAEGNKSAAMTASALNKASTGNGLRTVPA